MTVARIAFTASLVFFAPVLADAAPGKLVIVGGALADDNDAVHRAFIEASVQRNPRGIILIVPAASASPAESAARFRSQLASRGVSEDRIQVLPLAVRDDASSRDVDESSWAVNGDDEALAEKARSAAGFWFVGGDQSRTASVLLDSNGGDRKVLAAIREAHRAGAVLGGTSAGAAIMSDPMLVGGDSLGALRHGAAAAVALRPNQDAGLVEFSKGFGFFPHGIVDQHFDEKARQARLVIALHEAGVQRGYGVDEDTALVVCMETATAEVVGSGGVTVVDLASAKFSERGAPFSCSDVRLDLLSNGDRIRLTNSAVEPGPGRKETVGREYFAVREIVQGGVFASYGRFRELATHLLVDNSEVSNVRSLVLGADSNGWSVRLAKDARTRGWWLSGSTYTVIGLRMDIEPVSVTVVPR